MASIKKVQKIEFTYFRQSYYFVSILKNENNTVKESHLLEFFDCYSATDLHGDSAEG